MLDAHAIQLIQQTTAAIKQQTAAINTLTYQHLKRDHPSAYTILAKAKLPPLGSVVASYAASIDNLEPFLRHAPNIARVHQRVQLRPEHFDMLGDSLFSAMRQVLDPQQLSTEALAAWRGAFAQLAATLIELQARLENPAALPATADHE